MKKYISYLFVLMAAAFFAACQDKDMPGEGAMMVAAPDASQIKGELNGYDYTLSWPAPEGDEELYFTYYVGDECKQGWMKMTDNSYTVYNLEAGEEYRFAFKYKEEIMEDGDRTSIWSQGTNVKYTRPGAASVKNLKATPIVQEDGSVALKITWEASANAEEYMLTATNGRMTINESLPSDMTEYLVAGSAVNGKWNVSVTAKNSEGLSLVKSDANVVGLNAFVSQYATPEELLAKGDDDEQCAWLWFQETFPLGDFVTFSNVTSADVVKKYAMLFWMRDIETGNANDVWTMPAAAEAAAPYIKEYVQQGGNLLLWQHAVPYIGTIGRLDNALLKEVPNAIGCGIGGMNGDTWKMGVCIANEEIGVIDFSKHPIYEGLETERLSDGCPVGIAMKGPGFTADHNCLFFDIPTKFTGLPNNTKACYDALTSEHGIYPLGTWDSQAAWVSQLNIWEAKAAPKAPNGFTQGGSIICIGNGGCEFSMKNADGTPDISAHPKNNKYQDNILKMAKNAVVYLMSK